METLELYDTEEARDDVASGKLTGKEASEKKWWAIADALYAIDSEIRSPCGLCHATEGCYECPLQASEADEGCGPEYDEAASLTASATKAAWAMLHRIQAIPKDKQ